MKKRLAVSVEKVGSEDFDKFSDLIRLFEDVFEMQNFVLPRHEHLRKLLKKRNFMVFVALEKNVVVGGLTAYVLEAYYSERPQAYLYDLAVGSHYQRQGVGRALVEALNDYCRNEGFEEVFVQADRIDTHALEFYRSTSPTEEEEVVHFYYSLLPEKQQPEE